MLKIILTIAIVISFILVGAPIKYNCLELNIGIILIGTIYVIHKILIKKEKIKIQKIDIIILIFYVSPIIPLIFNTYNSLEETMISLVRNISLFNLYIISKQILENKNEQYLLNGILIGGIILSILGIDERAGGLIYKHLEVIGIPFVTNIESRMFSSLGYANSFAIIMATEILICCYKIQITKNKIPKVIYCIMIGLFAICLILSYSRTVIAMLAIMILAYVIFIKKKKIYLKISIATIIVICISYIIGLNFDKPLTIFENKENIDEVKREIYKVEEKNMFLNLI